MVDMAWRDNPALVIRVCDILVAKTPFARQQQQRTVLTKTHHKVETEGRGGSKHLWRATFVVEILVR